MIKPVLTVLLLFACIDKLYAQQKPIEQEWVQQDSIFIAKVISAYRTDPLSLESFLSCKGNRKEKLGFGYEETNGSNGKGYVSFFYDLIYYRNHLVSYRIDPQMPKDERLTVRYKKFYAPLFSFSGDQPDPLYYGYKEMTKPLSPMPGEAIKNKQLLFYMTPYSGTMYGYQGGWGTTLSNRASYLLLKRSITPQICNLLLYSKNPATRLTAIEYYHQHSSQFKTDKQQIEKRIKEVFDELPEISTMAADKEITGDARNLVREMISKH